MDGDSGANAVTSVAGRPSSPTVSAKEGSRDVAALTVDA